MTHELQIMKEVDVNLSIAPALQSYDYTWNIVSNFSGVSLKIFLPLFSQIKLKGLGKETKNNKATVLSGKR